MCLLMTKPLLAPQLPARMVSHLYFMTHLSKRKKDLRGGGVGPNACACRQVQPRGGSFMVLLWSPCRQVWDDFHRPTLQYDSHYVTSRGFQHEQPLCTSAATGVALFQSPTLKSKEASRQVRLWVELRMGGVMSAAPFRGIIGAVFAACLCG